MGQMSTKCARLRQWWSFRGPTSGGEADSRRTAALRRCWIGGARVGRRWVREVREQKASYTDPGPWGDTIRVPQPS